MRQDLIDLARAIVTASPKVLRLAHNEEDKSATEAKDAAYFIKLNEQRLGRDIELYGFLGESLMGWQGTLAIFLEEVVLPLKQTAPDGYAVACEGLKKLGEKVYPPELQAEWQSIFTA